MQKIKRVLFVFSLLSAVLFLFACGDNKIKLILPNEVTANVENLSEIKKNTEITLTVNVPAGKQIDEFMVNGKKVELEGNTYIFTITKTTVVLVSFKDIQTDVFYSLTLPAGVTANVTNLENILEGTSVTLTLSIPEGKELDYLKVNGVNVTVSNNKYTFNIALDTVVLVSFKDIQTDVFYSLTLPAGVTANLTNLENILEGTSVTLTLSIPEGKELDYLKVNGTNVDVSNNEYTFSITVDTVVLVQFKDLPSLTYYSLTLPAEITADVTDLQNILEGTSVTLTVNIPAGKELDYLKVNGVNVTVSSNKYTFSIALDTVVLVQFKDLPTGTYYLLTLPAGVTSDVVNLDSILEGTSVTLTVNIPAGKELEYLKVNGVSVVVSNNKYTFSIAADTTVLVSFLDLPPVEVYYSLTLPTGVTANVADLQNILEGTSVTLTVSIPAGKELEYLKVNGASVVVSNNKYTFSIAADTTVLVSFLDLPPVEVYYSLTLPTGVTTNVADLQNILEGTSVILTINVPDDKALESISINGVITPLAVNTYTFTIQADTIVEVYYQSIWDNLSLSDMLEIVNLFNGSIFAEGNLEINALYEDDYRANSFYGIIKMNDHLDITNGHLTHLYNYKDYPNEEMKVIYYTDGQLIYIKMLEYEQGEVVEEDEEIIPVSLNSQFLESLGSILLMTSLHSPIGMFLPSGPFSLNDLLDGFISYGLNKLLANGELFNLFEFKKYGDTITVSLDLNYEQIYTLFSEFIEDVFQIELGELGENDYLNINIEVVFYKYQLATAILEYGVSFDGNEQSLIVYISSSQEEPEEFLYLDDFDASDLLMYLYHIHFDEQTVVDILVSDELIPNVDYFGDEELVSLFSFYKEGHVVSGLYLDSAFSIPLSYENLLNTDLDIYIKWQLKPTISEYIDKFFQEEYLLFGQNEFLYIENDEFILSLETNYEEYLLFDKTEEKLYYLVTPNFEDFTAYEVTNDQIYLVSVLDALRQMEEDEFILEVKSNYMSLDTGILLLDEMIWFTGLVDYGIENIIYRVIEDRLVEELDEIFALLKDAVDNPLVDEVVNLDFYCGPSTYADIHEIESELAFIVEYLSGLELVMTLKEAKQAGILDYILPTADNGYRFVLIYQGDEIEIYDYIFYDSLLGPIVVFRGIDGYTYLSELEEFPAFTDSDFDDFVGWKYDTDDILVSVEELKSLGITSEIIYLYAVTKPKDFADVLAVISEDGFLFLAYHGFDIYYNIENQEYYIDECCGWGYDTVLRFTDEFLIIFSPDNYFEIPLENLSYESFFYSIFVRDFYYGFDHEFIEFLGFIHDLFTGEVAFEMFDDYYIYEDYAELYIFPEYNQLNFIYKHQYYQMTYNNFSYGDFETNYNYEYVIVNDVVEHNLTIKSKYQSGALELDRAYGYTDFAFVYYYYLDDDGVVDYETVFDIYLAMDQPYIKFYAKYVPYVEPADYLMAINNNDSYILRSEKFEIRVKKDIQILIYDEGELLYVLDLVTKDAYIYNNSVLYKLQDYHSVFNIQSFIEQLENDHFYYDNINTFTYQTHINNIKSLYSFTLNIGTGEMHIDSPSLVHYYSYPYFAHFEAFELIDIADYQVETEEIDEILFFSMLDRPIPEDEINYQYVEIAYNTGRYSGYYVDEFLEEFDGIFYFIDGEAYIEATINQELVTIKLSDKGILVYDTDYDVVILYLDNYYYPSHYPMFSYLNQITELPEADYNDYNGFMVHLGWFIRNVSDNLVTLEDLKEQNYKLGDIIYLQSSVDYDTLKSIDILEENNVVDITFERTATFGTFSMQYIYEHDAFIVYGDDYFYEISGYVVFRNNKIIVYNADLYYEFDVNVFEITTHSSLSLFWQDEFDYFIDMLKDIRKFLLKDYDANSIEKLFSGTFLIDEWIYVWMDYDYIGIEPFNEGLVDYFVTIHYPYYFRSYIIDGPADYDYNFTIINEYNDDVINFKSNVIILNLFTFTIAEKDFDDYYYLDEFEQPDFSDPIDFGEVDPGNYLIFMNLV